MIETPYQIQSEIKPVTFLYLLGSRTFFRRLRIPGGGGRVLGSTFAEYVPLASQNPYPITVYSVANY